uniref:Evasin n=1 Tax=Amblyomma cajennense TaxID=34607 RepID=A0A023FF05_AMBCJ
MKALLYASLFCFVLLASNGFPTDDDSSESDTDYDDYSGEPTIESLPTTTTKVPCEYLHLEGETNMKPIGCTRHCPNDYHSMDDGIPCYTLDLAFARKMTKDVWYLCNLGKCSRGYCRPNNRSELCRRRGHLNDPANY